LSTLLALVAVLWYTCLDSQPDVSVGERMKRRACAVLRTVLVVLLGTLVLGTLSAAQAPEIKITSPQMNAELRGKVLINGTAALPQFDYYKVEFGIGPNPSDWALVGEIHRTPVTDGLLETWDTTVLPDGLYSLRLRVVKPDGNYAEYYVRQVKIVNTVPTSTPTATVSPTIPPTPVVMETYTPVFTKPTAALAQPTPTPTLARPTRETVSPLGSAKDFGNALLLGAGAMGVIFLLVGLVLAVRRVL